MAARDDEGPRLRWYHDVVSPFAYLQWPRLRALAVEREVALVPVLFGAVLDAVGQKGPAEIPGKREFTYRHVLWRARRAGQPLRFPPAHPFNPLPALRLLLAAGNTVAATDAVYDWIWARGGDPSASALAPLAAGLGVDGDAWTGDAAKAALRANTQAALDAGLYGVPTLAVGDQLFWGEDAHDFALDVLADPDLLADDEMRRLATLPTGIRRG